MKIKVLLSIALSLALICSGTSVWAGVSGECSDCHTMHNSQNGTFDQTLEGTSLSDGPSRALTKGDCVGCHTGTNDGTNNIPYVQGSGAVYTSADGSSGNTLAGGSFYFLQTKGDASGHNVYNLDVTADTTDAAIGETPPGWDQSVTSSNEDLGTIAPTDSDTWSSQLTCAGTYGCHGPHKADDDFEDIAGAHHGDDSVINGSSAAKSYRFLNGIIGYEDSDWEYQPTANARNAYHGEDRTTVDGPSDTKTISYFCATCHGNFHNGSEINYYQNSTDTAVGTNPWLRHPSDYDMANTATDSEYRNYNDGGTAYSVEAPVAFDLGTSVDSDTYTLAAPFSGTDTAIVTCISCHRAHGSPYADLLRWDYNSDTDSMEAASGATADNNTGCFVCHTTKDGYDTAVVASP